MNGMFQVKGLCLLCAGMALAAKATEALAGTRTKLVIVEVRKAGTALSGAELRVSGSFFAPPCTPTPGSQWNFPYKTDASGQCHFDGQTGNGHGPKLTCTGDGECAKGKCTWFIAARDPRDSRWSGTSDEIEAKDCCDKQEEKKEHFVITLRKETAYKVGVPTMSAWALVVMALLLFTGAKIYFGRREDARTHA